jgi:MFS family permease
VAAPVLPAPNESATPPSSTTLWTRAFVALLLVQFSYGTAFSTFFALPKYLIEELGASATLVGNAHGAFAIVGVVLVPLIGSALDRLGRRPVLLLGLGVGAVSFAAFGWVHSPWAILLLRAVHGLSFALTFNAGAALAADLSPPSRRGAGIGYFGTALLVTNGFGPWLGEVVAERFEWRTVFLGCGAFSALGLYFATRLPRVPVVARRGSTTRVASPALLTAYGAALALGIGVGVSKTFIPALLVEAGLPRVAPYFVAFTAGALLQRTLLGSLPDRLGHRRAAGLSLLAYGGLMVLVLPLSIEWVPWLAVGIGVAHGLGYPAIGALAVGLGDDAARGRITTWVTGGFNLGWALSTAGFGRLEPALGYGGLVTLGGLCLLLAGLVVPLLVSRFEAGAVLGKTRSQSPVC